MLEKPAQVQFCASLNEVYVWSTTVYVYTRESSWNKNSNTLESERPQHDSTVSYVIAQEYFSTTFVSCFHYHNKNFGISFKNIYFSFFTYFKKVALIWKFVSVVALLKLVLYSQLLHARCRQCIVPRRQRFMPLKLFMFIYCYTRWCCVVSKYVHLKVNWWL